MIIKHDVTAEMVYVGHLSYATRRAWAEYSAKHDFDEWLGDKTWIQSHWFAWLIQLLMAEADDPELFPKGQWATIQIMQEIVEASAKMAVKA